MNNYIAWIAFGIGIALTIAYDMGAYFNQPHADSYILHYHGGDNAIFAGPMTDSECHIKFDKLMKDEFDSIRSKPNTNTELLHAYCIP